MLGTGVGVSFMIGIWLVMDLENGQQLFQKLRTGRAAIFSPNKA